jgi:signal transduction histidine kinase/CheY-like chemotaxis protein
MAPAGGIRYRARAMDFIPTKPGFGSLPADAARASAAGDPHKDEERGGLTGAAASIHRLDQLRSEQVAGFYRNALPGTLGSLLAATIVSSMLAYVRAIPLSAGAVFLALNAASNLARVVLLRTYRISRPAVEDWRLWSLWAIATALAGGLCWGFGSLLLLDPGRAELQFIVFLTCAGTAAGAITSFGTFLPAYYCNLFAIMLPTAVWSALQGDILHGTYAVLAVLWIVIVAFLARTFGRILAESLHLQFENLDLANNLRHQKELAEEANVAKSRFLASASHDLRQPVHALGMFVGALRDRPLDDGSRKLVRQIENSIGALDSLFAAILDISRLDAGVIEARPQAFPIQPLLERTCQEAAPDAERRGLTLRLVPCSVEVETDPVLLERILRNLVSNALRYTEDGSVVVGCRRGARLSVEVWDSGCGIAADQQDLIFQEFYQIGNPERDRTRGLGLGLAIVRRLTQILDIPMALRSELDRGSVFKLSVPIAARGPAPVERAAPVLSGPLRSLFVLVIDDEAAIQEAMRTLLTAWGHSVVAAGSCAEMLELAAEFSRQPDLIISDYRLRGEENGLDTIERLRSEFNDDIPAILITGDTAPNRIREATASDCLLLHKPVSNAKLRTAIIDLTIAGAPV